ncbi:MAG: hypothetical protein FWC93_04380 [Defluviitaleaceae bacterium]|nr:hypothetical protein [Defluviitaleaceae bacterium]
MKKIRNALLLLLPALFLAACSSEGADSFFSFEHNLLLTYEVDGENPFSYQIFNSFATNNRVQRRIVTEGMGHIMAEVLEVRDGELLLVNASSNLPEHVNITDDTALHAILLAEPITVGNHWMESPFDLENSSTREITGTGITITTPAGTFETIEVTLTFANDDTFITPARLREYIAPGVGMVKQIAYSGISTDWADWETAEERIVTTRLVDIQRNAALTETIDILYSIDGDFTRMDILHTTNNDLTELYAPVAQRLLSKSLGVAANEDISINFAIINPETRALNLDFCTHFAAEISKVEGFEQEQRILHAVVNTFGILYTATSVRVTIDGQPYSGPNITKAHTEFIPVGVGLWYE